MASSGHHDKTGPSSCKLCSSGRHLHSDDIQDLLQHPFSRFDIVDRLGRALQPRSDCRRFHRTWPFAIPSSLGCDRRREAVHLQPADEFFFRLSVRFSQDDLTDTAFRNDKWSVHLHLDLVNWCSTVPSVHVRSTWAPVFAALGFRKACRFHRGLFS